MQAIRLGWMQAAVLCLRELTMLVSDEDTWPAVNGHFARSKTKCPAAAGRFDLIYVVFHTW